MLSNKTYDVLKWIALVCLPAVGTLYAVLADIWGLPYAVQMVGTITAIDAFLGALLGISSSSYSNSKTTKKTTKKSTKKTAE